jgi:hypothetical protein
MSSLIVLQVQFRVLRRTIAQSATDFVRASKKYWPPFYRRGCAHRSIAVSKICNVSDSGRNRNAIQTYDCCAGSDGCAAVRRPGGGDGSGSHPLVDFGRRGGGGRRIRQGVRRDRQSLGRRRYRRLRRHGAADHDQPHHWRRSHGRHPVQPWPASGRIGGGRPDARLDRSRNQGQVDGNRATEEPARRLYPRRQDLLRAGQHSLLAMAVAVERGLRKGRCAGAEKLE